MSFLTNNVVTRNYSLKLFLTSILLTLSSANFAFDNQGFSQTQAMSTFARQFGDYNKAKKTYSLPSTFLSLSNACPFLMLIVGVIVGSNVSNRFGRRMTVFTMSIWAMVCVPIVITSKNRNQFLAGRILNSLYIGMEMSTIPVFQSEIVPGAVRGLAVGSYQMSFGVGGFVISGIVHRTATIPNNWSWRIPFLCYLIVPSIICSCIWFQPESPRWLVMRNRIEEARTSLAKFRKADHNVEEELQQIILAVELEKSLQQGSYLSCFRAHSLRRTMIVLGSNFFLQATGQAFVSLYGPIVVQQLGGLPVFQYTLIAAGVTLFGYMVSLSANDRLGRRVLMLSGAAGQTIGMFVIAGVGSITPRTDPLKQCIVAFILIYGFAFGVGWAPSSYILSSEIPSQQQRDKTSQMGFVCSALCQFVVAFSLPYMINEPGNMGVKVGFIFAPISAVAFAFAYFCIPECKGLKLEQVDILFEEKVSARRSARWAKEHRAQNAFDVDAIERGSRTPEKEELHETLERVTKV